MGAVNGKVNDRPVITDDELAEFSPPMALEAERYVIAAMLRSSAAIDAATDVVEENDFYRPGHRIVFAVMALMWACEEPVSKVTLLERLEHSGQTAAVGGPDRVSAYVDELLALPSDPGAVRAHAEIIRDRSLRRRVMEVGVRMRQLALRSEQDPAQVIGQAEAEAAELARMTMQTGTDAPMTITQFRRRKWARTEELIPGLLRREEVVLMVATEGSGKTTTGLQVMTAAACGIHPFLFASVQFPARRVLVMDLENKRGHLHDELGKFEALGERQGWDPDNMIIWSRTSGVDLHNPAHQGMLTRVIRQARPDLVFAGPIYKMVRERAGESAEATHSLVTDFWGRALERFGFALWLEGHVPGQQGPTRLMKPLGSSVYQRWPDFGFALVKEKKGDRFSPRLWERFRDDRIEGRGWPDKLERNTTPGLQWPWTPVYKAGTLASPLPFGG